MGHDLPTPNVPALLATVLMLAEGIGRLLLNQARNAQGRSELLPEDIAALRAFFELLDKWDRE